MESNVLQEENPSLPVLPELRGRVPLLLMAKERMLSTPPDFRTRVTKHVRLSMKNFRSFFIVLSFKINVLLVFMMRATTLILQLY